MFKRKQSTIIYNILKLHVGIIALVVYFQLYIRVCEIKDNYEKFKYELPGVVGVTVVRTVGSTVGVVTTVGMVVATVGVVTTVGIVVATVGVVTTVGIVVATVGTVVAEVTIEKK